MVASLAQRAELPMPRLYMIPQEQPNAFATGRNPKHAAIAVTAGIRRHMPAYQLEGVLAHEFAHIKNRDILIQSVGGDDRRRHLGRRPRSCTFSFLFGGGDDDDSPLGFVGALATIILAPIAATIIQLGDLAPARVPGRRHRRRSIMGAPEPLADALETLEPAPR